MATYDFSSLRVIVVDDSPFMCITLKALLNAMGITAVHRITVPTELFDDLAAFQPDLIFTDQIMAPISGLELIREIRSNVDCPWRCVPMVLVTGHSRADVVKAARFWSGADAVLAKPVSVQRLHACILALYRSPRTFVQTKTYFGPDRRVTDRPFEGEDQRSSSKIGARYPHSAGRSADTEAVELELR